MPDYATLIELVKRSDSGLLTLTVVIVSVSFILLYLSQLRVFVRVGVERFGHWAYPLFTGLINPPLGLASAGVVWISRRLVLSLSSPVTIVQIGFGLRIVVMNTSLWYDEAFTARLVSLPLEMLPNAILSDVHPPLYYVLLWVWTHVFGDSSALWLRLPSMLLSLLSIYLVYRLVIRLHLGKVTALWSAVLVATLPASIFYGTEARHYTLVTVMVMSAMIAILEQRPRLFAVLMVALPLTHNVGYLYMLMLAIGCLYAWRYQWRRWVPAIAAGFFAAAAWLPAMWIQSSYINDGFWAYISAGGILRPLINMTVGLIGHTYTIVMVIPVIIFTALGLWALYRRNWFRRRQGVLWLLVVFGALALDVIISLVWKPIFVYRHFFPAVMLLIIAWAYLMSQSRLAVSVMIPVLCLALFSFYTEGLNTIRPDYRGLLAEHCSGADSFYATSINSAFLTLANDERPTLLWAGAVDNGTTLTGSVMPHYNIQTALLSDFRGQTVCIMQIDRPETSYKERLVISFIQERYPMESSIVSIGKWNDLIFHRVEVE